MAGSWIPHPQGLLHVITEEQKAGMYVETGLASSSMQYHGGVSWPNLRVCDLILPSPPLTHRSSTPASLCLRLLANTLLPEYSTNDVLTEVEAAVVVSNTLSEIDVSIFEVSVQVPEAGTENGGSAALDGEGDVLSAVGEVLSSPLKGAFLVVSYGFAEQRRHCQHTVVIANELVEIDLGIDLVAPRVAEAGPEDMAVVNTDVLG